MRRDKYLQVRYKLQVSVRGEHQLLSPDHWRRVVCVCVDPGSSLSGAVTARSVQASAPIGSSDLAYLPARNFAAPVVTSCPLHLQASLVFPCCLSECSHLAGCSPFSHPVHRPQLQPRGRLARPCGHLVDICCQQVSQQDVCPPCETLANLRHQLLKSSIPQWVAPPPLSLLFLSLVH